QVALEQVEAAAGKRGLFMPRIVQIDVGDAEFQLPAGGYVGGRKRLDDPLPCDRVDAVRAHPGPDVKGRVGFHPQQVALMREAWLFGVEVFAFRGLPKVGPPAGTIVELGSER